jgi:predicted glycosyltransferase
MHRNCDSFADQRAHLTEEESETKSVDTGAEIRKLERQSVSEGSGAAGRSIWIDLDNSPHVPFFRPIIRQLELHGYRVLVTARDCFQVCGLAEQLHLACRPIGRHYGKYRIMKLLGLGIRTLQLLPLARQARPALAVSHGSRSQLVAAKLLGIPTLQIADYEFAKIWAVVRPSWAMTPAMIPNDAMKLRGDRILKYPGIKEDVYVASFLPQDGIRQELGIAESEILVTIRPPASEAHYHSPDSDKLFRATIAHLAPMPEVRIVVLPRTPKQGQKIMAAWPELCSNRKLFIPERVVDGLNLIWHSDLVISGGGTMNREAAALGVPVYSIFRGTIGAVDQYLAANGRLVLLESTADLTTKLSLRRRNRGAHRDKAGQGTLQVVTNHIIRLAETASRNKAA